MTEAELDKILANSFIDLENKQKSAFVILFDGRKVEVRSGKSLWPSAGAAKNALNNHLYCYKNNHKKFDFNAWVNKHIRIVSLTDYEKSKQKLKELK